MLDTKSTVRKLESGDPRFTWANFSGDCNVSDTDFETDACPAYDPRGARAVFPDPGCPCDPARDQSACADGLRGAAGAGFAASALLAYLAA